MLHAPGRLPLVALLMAVGCAASLARGTEVAGSQRAPSILDSIEMTHIGEPVAEFVPTMPSVIWAPDKKEFVIITWRGDLRDDSIGYRLLLFPEATHAEIQAPITLWSVASHSNSPGIQSMRWSRDGKSLLFVGQSASGVGEVFSFDLRSKSSLPLTEHPTDVLGFDVSEDMRTLVYVASPPRKPLFDVDERSRGLLISNQWLPELLAGRRTSNPFLEPAEVFVLHKGSPVARPIRLPAGVSPRGEVSVGPDGRFALLAASIEENAEPRGWHYAQSFVGWGNIPVFLVADLDSDAARLLLDAPAAAPGGIPFAWLNDGRSVIVNTYLPLDVKDFVEQEARRAAPFSAEVDVRDSDVTKIVRGYCELTDWDSGTSSGTFTARQDAAESLPLVPGTECAAKSARYRKLGDRWRPIQPSKDDLTQPAPAVRVFQNMNTPPELVAEDALTGVKRRIWNPNPQFSQLRFAHVETIEFSGSDGARYQGGLYVPPDVVAGRRYPLVIQTHGWNPDRFEIDGESTAGYAAQALAAHGIFVAQLPEAAELTSEREGPQNSAEYEGLVRYLDDRGLIDSRRVGIQAWSRTGYSVRYSLAFSHQSYAAALIVDGMEGGYVQDMLSGNVDDGDVTFERLNGGKPFGAALDHWRMHSPLFNLDRVHTPVLQYMLGADSFMNMWETFVGLKQLHKPVEMIWLPDSNHWPIRPRERLAVQQGAVDWFRFWLQRYEDGASAKRAQYSRWRALREIQEGGGAASR